MRKILMAAVLAMPALVAERANACDAEVSSSVAVLAAPQVVLSQGVVPLGSYVVPSAQVGVLAVPSFSSSVQVLAQPAVRQRVRILQRVPRSRVSVRVR